MPKLEFYFNFEVKWVKVFLESRLKLLQILIETIYISITNMQVTKIRVRVIVKAIYGSTC